MKKMILAFIAVLALSTGAYAQNNDQSKKMTPQEMVQKRTDRIVQKYGLDSNQAKQLFELNQKYAGKMGPMGMRGQGMRGQGMNGQGMRGQGMRGQGMNGQGMNQQRQRPSLEDMQKRVEQMKADSAAYHQGLQKIMTKDQYEKFMNDRQSFRQNAGQHKNGGKALE